MSSRRRLGAGLALTIAIAAVIGIVLAVESPSSTSGAGNRSQASGATTVERRDLVQTDTESGTLSYASPRTVYNRLSGTITWLPSVGQVIKPGEALYKVSGEPVILMNGTTPAYRDLSPADSAGPDILELNRSLVALGFNPEGIVVDDVWQPATTAAVEVFQESLGEAPTGSLTLGQVVFLPGDQTVTALEATLGSGSGGSGGTPSSSAADTSPTVGRPEFVSLTSPTGQTGQTGQTGATGAQPPRQPGTHRGTAQTIAALLALIRAESAQLRAETAELRAAQASAHNTGHSGAGNSGSSSGGRSGGGSPASNGSGGGGSSGGGGGAGGGGGSATAILQTSSTQLIVTVDLDASKQSEAKVGEKVTVQMPNGTTVNGTVTAVSAVAQSSSGSGSGNGGSGSGGGGNGSNGSGNGGNGGNGSSSATVPVTVTLSRRVSGAGLDQAAVSVNFAQAKAHNVLSVPVTALLAVSGGGYAVQEATPPHRLIPVTVGLFAAGYVEISGPGVYPGLEVTDSQG